MEHLTSQTFVRMKPEDIGRLKKKEMKDLLKESRRIYEDRLKTLNNQGRYFYSPAQEKIEDYYDHNPMANIESMTRNKAMVEVFQLQDFFKAQTSTVKGARKNMRKVNERIFGINEATGRAKSKLTKDEMARYWAVYNEFIHQRKTALDMFTSGKIQQYLGERVLSTEGKKLDVDMDTIDSIWNELQSINLAEDDANAGRNIFTGRRNNRNR